MKKINHSRLAISLTRTVVCTCLLASCNLYEFTPFDIDFEEDEKNIHQKNKMLLSDFSPKNDSIQFIFLTDNQNSFDELDDVVKDISARDDIPFAILGGDITEFGLPEEYRVGLEFFKKMRIPFFSTIGNHDLLGTGIDAFEEMYGPLNDSFTLDSVKFIFYNTNSREFQYDFSVPDIVWLENELQENDSVKASIIFSHVGIKPTDNSIDLRLFPKLDSIISNTPNVLANIHGHGHETEITFPYTNKDIPSIQIDDVIDKNYSIFTISSNLELTWEIIEVE
ncbi:metallophosphoesterase family protein [Sediminitomix flava]|uniref:Calcineurin-like phosphoesterase family protein n=1 Tax=Sediminitomix flava TaxID=379075 RepID=A0A315ZAG1_SEDFL|nr:metallophosphoesterase [Sediminitomix flava]PWJ42330.1 calcineurin-like phosphoesterase family protein [Sediminitomix flava]